MAITPNERTRLFTERNNLLKKANESLKQRNYLDAALFLEDAIVCSNIIGEEEREKDYYEKILECIDNIESIEDSLGTDQELKSEFLKEKNDLILSAQEAAQNQEFQKAIGLYRKAVTINLQLKDKTSIWKLSKTISLLAKKISPTQMLSAFVSGEPQEEKPQVKFAIPIKEPPPQQPVKKELPFFRAIIDKKEEKPQQVMPEKKPDKVIKPKEKEKVEKKDVKQVKPEKLESGKVALPSDVLAEIRNFQHKELESVSSESKEPKKTAGEPSTLREFVIEELKKKVPKK
jgi:tetratricopeptide (TPR) repeat protein